MTDNTRNGNDRMEIHYRQQLSALMDGDLSPDEARFLLRRLQHDTDLGDRWERWQMAGEALRGRTVVPLPSDFSQRVVAAIAAEPLPSHKTSSQMPRWTRWGGGALAASVALVALFMTQQQSPLETPTDSRPPSRTVAAAPAAAPIRQQPAPRQPAVDPGTAAALAAATVAVAELPRRTANNRASARTQGQRASRASSRNAAQPIAVAAVAVPAAAAAATARLSAAATAAASSNDPFASLPIAPSRPWPSATLPQFPASGAFRADYSAGDSYYPFQPRLPSATQSDAVAPEAQETP